MSDTVFTINVIKKGLARHLLLVILFLVLTPSLLISGLSYQIASKGLYKESVDKLSSIAALQEEHVKNLVNRILLDLSIESERKSTILFLSELNNAFKQSNQMPNEFIRSFKWYEIIENNDVDIRRFGKTYDYYDVYLINNNGQILFNLTNKNDLGTNIFNGLYANTAFGKAAQKSFKTGHIVFSGFESYEPSNNKVSSFFVDIVVDENGDKIGLIAFQAKQKKFDEIMQSKIDINSYLMNEDLKIRTHIDNASVNNSMGSSIHSEKVKQWVFKNMSAFEKNEKVLNYIGIQNVDVIGVLHTLVIADKRFIIVAEEAVSTIFSTRNNLAKSILLLLFISLLVVILLVFRVIKELVTPIIKTEEAVAQITSGKLDQNINIDAKFELASLVKGLSSMQRSLKETHEKTNLEDWYQEGTSILNEILRGEKSVANLSRESIRFLCEYLGASVGAFYIVDDNKIIRLKGSYAFQQRKDISNTFLEGEGIVGQVVLEQQPLFIHNVPEDYMVISSGLGHSSPNVLSIFPLIWNHQVKAVIEIGSSSSLTKNQQNLITSLSAAICISLNSSISRESMNALLHKTQDQAEQLQAREEELRENNDMLTEQSHALEQSAAEMEEKNNALQTQQEELRTSNEELEVKTLELETTAISLEGKNTDLDLAQIDLQKKADDLAASSQYKSEFLANMSHELRTPLNSLLILAKLLADNNDDNLSEKQIEYASTIHDSGSDLLNLINEILDLSKIEAGHMNIHIEQFKLSEVTKDIERKFKPLTDKKGLYLKIINQLDDSLVTSDINKLGQIVKNLISNAIKFTEEGGITITIAKPENNDLRQYEYDGNMESLIKISVTDTGIGLAEAHLYSIFEAFQQADGTTSRKFGGTGLGLSISRELSRLLGGNIFVQSTLGEGSIFTIIIKKVLSLKDHLQAPSQIKTSLTTNKQTLTSNQETLENLTTNEVTDDRLNIKQGDRCLLIIEDDYSFANILCKVAHDKSFKVLVANDGETGLYYADYYKPSGIILDIGLPNMDGWEVLNRLKNNLETRHIPVHFISANDKTVDAMKSGALGYLTKPVSIDVLNDTMSQIESFINQPMKNLLVIEDNKIQRENIIELIGNGDVKADSAESGEQALNLLKAKHYDCIVLDLGLPDMEGTELLEKIRMNKNIKEIPVVIYSGKELNRSENEILKKYANRIIIKNARSPEMLLDETALFLHRVQANLPKDRQKTLRMLHDNQSVLEDRNILIVDDDMRNIFALTTMLRDKGMKVVSAKNGLEALSKLDDITSPDLVLMDIMMPEMDGYEAMQKIRAQEKYAHLPIIALTAKAMKGDRAKCIKAGANDYLSKPIDTDKLLSMMRVWLYK